MKFKEEIHPFQFNEYEEKYSLCLEAGEYKQEVFKSSSKEGFEGNGYDWEALSRVIISNNLKELEDEIRFDCEDDKFRAVSENKEALKKLAFELNDACKHDAIIQYYLSKAK